MAMNWKKEHSDEILYRIPVFHVVSFFCSIIMCREAVYFGFFFAILAAIVSIRNLKKSSKWRLAEFVLLSFAVLLAIGYCIEMG